MSATLALVPAATSATAQPHADHMEIIPPLSRYFECIQREGNRLLQGYEEGSSAWPANATAHTAAVLLLCKEVRARASASAARKLARAHPKMAAKERLDLVEARLAELDQLVMPIVPPPVVPVTLSPIPGTNSAAD